MPPRDQLLHRFAEYSAAGGNRSKSLVFLAQGAEYSTTPF